MARTTFYNYPSSSFGYWRGGMSDGPLAQGQGSEMGQANSGVGIFPQGSGAMGGQASVDSHPHLPLRPGRRGDRGVRVPGEDAAVSEQPGTPPPAAGGKKENVFTHKIGPLPMWGWVAIVGGGLVAYRLYSNKNAAASTGATTAATDTTANTVPQFVNQTYVSTTAPLGPSTAASSGGTATGSTAAVPTNPSPVGTSSQPKPTTTLSGWSYPAPSGLSTYDVAGSGVRLSWNAVTGPSGQHPNSYTVATYNSKGVLVDQFSTAAGNTNTAEYGKGGKGLPKGTYHTNVWANGGPVAPQHATVQYSLTS